jgi:hypothetical protein
MQSSSEAHEVHDTREFEPMPQIGFCGRAEAMSELCRLSRRELVEMIADAIDLMSEPAYAVLLARVEARSLRKESSGLAEVVPFAAP